MQNSLAKPATASAVVQSNDLNQKLLWPLDNVLRHLSLSRTCWLSGVKSGRFPQPIRLSARRVAWKSSDIYSLIDDLTQSQTAMKTSIDSPWPKPTNTTETKSIQTQFGKGNSND